jgi:hypothetical protein
MNTETAITTTIETASKHARKRTAAQRSADLRYAEHHHLRGRTHARIAEMLSKERGYSISRQQVAYDLKGLEQEWMAEAEELVGLGRARALKSLAMQEEAAWDGWDTSRRLPDVLAVLASPAHPSLRRKDANASFAGDPAFLKRVMEIHDRRTRLLGLEVPVAMTIQNSTVDSRSGDLDALTDEETDALLQGSYERRLRSAYAEKQGVEIQNVTLLPPQFTVSGQSRTIE